MSQYFPKPNVRSSGSVNFELDLSSYAAKADLKRATGADPSTLASKTDSVGLKTEVEYLDVLCFKKHCI